MAAIKGITIEIGADTKKLQASLNAVNKAAGSTQTELRQIERLLKLDPKNTELLAQKQQVLGKALENSKEKLEALKKAEEELQSQANKDEDWAERHRLLQREIIKTQNEINKLGNEVDGAADKMEKMQKSVDRTNAAMSTATKVYTAAVIAGGTAAFALGKAFEESMAGASTLFGDANVDMDVLNQKMLELSGRTNIAAEALGGALYNALSAGIPATDDMSEALSFLEGSAQLAKAGFTDIDTAMSATVKTLNAYGLGTEHANTIQKILIQTQNKGITTVGQLGNALAQVTPTAAAMNVSFDQVGAAIANMTARGTKTEQAITQLNALFAELGKNGTVAQKSLQAATKGTEYAKKSFSDLMAEGVPLSKLLDLISNYAKKNNKSMLDMFSSIEAGKAALTNSAEGADGFNEALSAMATTVDVVGEAYNKVTDTSSERFNGAMNDMKNAAISLFLDMQPQMADFFDGIRGGMEFIMQHKEGTIATIKGIGVALLTWNTAKAVSNTVSAVSNLTKGLTGAAAAQNALNIAQKGNVYGLAIEAVAALTTAVISLSSAETEAEKAAREHTEALQKRAEAAAEEYEAMQDLRQANYEEAASTAAQMENTEVLAKELASLADASGRVSDANKTRAAFILGELNNALGTEYTMVGNMIRGYETLISDVYKLIEAKKLDALMNAAQDNYDEAIKNKGEQAAKAAEDYRNLAAAITEMEKAEARVAELDAKPNEYGLFGFLLGKTERQYLLNDLENAKRKVEGLQETYDQSSAAYQQYLNDESTYTHAHNLMLEDKTSEAITYLEAQAGGLLDLAAAQERFGDDTGAILGAVSDTYQTRLVELLGALKTYSENATEENLSALHTTLGNMKTSAEDFEKAGGKIHDSMMIRADGTEVNLEPILTKIGEYAEKTPALGEDFADGFIDNIGTQSQISRAISNAVSLVASALEAIRKRQDSNSPAKETGYLGEDFVDGYVNEIKAGEKDATEAAMGLAESAVSALSRYVPEGVALSVKKNTWAITDTTKKHFEDLKLQREIDAISEAEYYARLEGLRDSYLEKGTKEWWDYTKELIGYQDNLAKQSAKQAEEAQKELEKQLKEAVDKFEKAKKDIKNTYDDIASEAISDLESVASAQASFADKLKGADSLFYKHTIRVITGDETFENTKLVLEDLDAQTEMLEAYGKSLSALREKGVPRGLLDVLQDMNIQEGAEFAGLLLSQSDEDFGKYIDAWERKQAAAESVSAAYYAEDVENVKKNYVDGMKTALSGLGEEYQGLGFNYAMSIRDGFCQGISSVASEMRRILLEALPSVSLIPGQNGAVYYDGNVGTTTNNQSYSPTFNIYSNNMTPAQMVEAASAQYKRDRLTGVIG